MQILNRYTKCGIFCMQCGIIDIKRPSEIKLINCPVCGGQDWVRVKLKVVEKLLG